MDNLETIDKIVGIGLSAYLLIPVVAGLGFGIIKTLMENHKREKDFKKYRYLMWREESLPEVFKLGYSGNRTLYINNYHY